MTTVQEMTTEEDTERFHITDEKSANWLLRQLANIEAEKRRVHQQAEEIVKGLDAEAKRLRYLYEKELEVWVMGELQRRGGRSKMLKMLQGTCSFRTVPQSLRITDESAAIEYAKEKAFPLAVETVEHLRTGVYTTLAKRALSETGEVMPGLEFVPEREAFTFRFGKDAEE